MADNRIIDDLGFNFEDNAEVTQESYNANNSGYSDLFQEKFDIKSTGQRFDLKLFREVTDDL